MSKKKTTSKKQAMPAKRIIRLRRERSGHNIGIGSTPSKRFLFAPISFGTNSTIR